MCGPRTEPSPSVAHTEEIVQRFPYEPRMVGGRLVQFAAGAAANPLETVLRARVLVDVTEEMRVIVETLFTA